MATDKKLMEINGNDKYCPVSKRRNPEGGRDDQSDRMKRDRALLSRKTRRSLKNEVKNLMNGYEQED